MANKRFLMGILVMALVFGMTVVGCDDTSTDDDKKGLNGTWESRDTFYKYVFNNGTYTQNWQSAGYTGPDTKGTYFTDGEKITIKETHVYCGTELRLKRLETKWYSENELQAAIDTNEFNISSHFSEHTYDYSLDGDLLSINGLRTFNRIK